jgi:hypothetical protein
MVKANLKSSYGYLDPETGERTYYGPGKDIDIPEGLAMTLGLISEEEEVEFEMTDESEFEGVVEETEEEVFGWDSVKMIPSNEDEINDIITDSLSELDTEPDPPLPAIDPDNPPDDLPEDYPGRAYLVETGIGHLETVNQMTFDDLVAIKGIGKVTAKAILDRRIGRLE